jgi:hypothetical protein
MADLHTQLEERYLDASKLPIRESSWKTFQNKTMLDDDCVDLMAEKLCQAVGSTMAGVPGEAVSPSSLLHISAEHAERFFVIGVMIAEALRMSGLNDDKTPILRMLVGKTNVKAAQEKRLDPFHHKSLLVLQTNVKARHTSLQELVRPCDSDTAAKLTWRHCIYDSNDADPKVDPALHKGIRSIMVKTDLIRPTDIFKRTRPIRFIKQKDSTVCGLMTFINLVQKLTGEELDPVHWDLFVDLVRLFFDLWIFYLAESKGAIRPGCLAWESCSPAGPGGNACCAQKGVAGLTES